MWWNLAMAASAFAVGAMLVHRHQSGRRSNRGRSVAASNPPASRPATQVAVLGIDALVQQTRTQDLLRSIERRTKFSSSVFTRDCQPVLEAFGEFVQLLPASECHHHAQPGGLWIHVLEVVDAALTYRSGLELPPGATTEERKRLEHRWTYAVFAAALLHDVGKPVTDLRVTLFADDPRAGRPWTPLAGSMRACGAYYYAVAFADSKERDYEAHSKLAAMLLHQFVPSRLMRWLAEDGDVLQQLLGFLAGEKPEGTLASIVKRADSDSVRRNLLHGPRTRFSTARTRPLIERLMEALRRMLIEGGQLPLNRPGAAGWVHDGCVWFVCARLAEEVRSYLSQHESLQGIPGKDRNDRLFDTWQESGACRPAPDGGAVWRVRIECEAWRSPDTLTVLCFPLDRLYPAPEQYPSAMNGQVLVELNPSTAGPAAAPSSPPPPVPAALAVPLSAPATAHGERVPPTVATAFLQGAEPASRATGPREGPSTTSAGRESPTAPSPAVDDGCIPNAHAVAPASPRLADVSVAAGAAPLAAQLAEQFLPAAAAVPSPAPAAATPRVVDALSEARPLLSSASPPSPSPVPPDSPTGAVPWDDVLPLSESAALVERATQVAPLPASAAPTTLGSPMRPHEAAQHARPKKAPTPAAEAFMAWVAHAVGSGALKYNEDGALVHFVPQGCLLLSPEIFRRFIDEHREMPEGPVAGLLASHGDKSHTRLQNELAKSGWSQRNGDENLHYYAFTKADGSLSRAAAFYLLPKPQLFWNPVPRPNDRIRPVARAKKLAVPSLTKPARPSSDARTP